MFVGAARVVAMVTASHSLKEKRAVVRRLKARVRERFEVTLAEVGALDAWQRVELGWAMASVDRGWVERALAEVASYIGREDGVEVIDVQRQITTFDGVAAPLDPVAVAAALEQTGAGDKAAATAGAGDDGWVPAAWREDGGAP
ncbi:MAG: DUF503 domain-containing protein [Kofleriaceae bacterium]